MSTLRGKLEDRGDIISAAFSKLEKAIIKATSHDLNVSKEKHVRTLILVANEQTHKITRLITLLGKRLESPDWMVAMKALGVFHRLLRDGNPNFLNEIKGRSEIFQLRKFSDNSSPEAHHQSVFVRKYSQYLEEKVLVYKTLRVEFERTPEVVKTYTVEELFERLPRLQSQLNALINTRASKDHINNPIIVTGFTYLINDSLKLYQALNSGVITLIENFFHMTVNEAQKALDIYKLFTRETEGLTQIFEISKKFSRKELPELQHAPTTLVEAFENYIDDLKKGRTPAPSDKHKEISKAAATPKKNDNWEKFEFSPNEDSVKGMDEAKFNAQFADPFGDPNKPSFDPFADDKDALPTSGPRDRSGTNTTSPTTRQTTAPSTSTDPFASTTTTSRSNDPFASIPPSNNSTSPSKDPFATNSPFGDLFGSSTTSSSSNQQQTSYDDKKKNIQQLLSQPPPSSTPGFGVMQSTPMVMPAQQQPQYNFPSQPFFGTSQPIPQQQQHFGMQQQQPFGMQQQQPFGMQQQQQQGFFGQPMQTQPQQQPFGMQAQASNPFASQPIQQTQQSQNTNPFAF